jgi:exopolysaccharide biosynthesis polyprenyl glycosylphosphotransferase
MVWRRLVAPARVVIVGEDPLAASTRRKLDLFRDIHAEVVGELSPADALDALRRRRPLVDGGCDRVIVATLHAEESLIAELLTFGRQRRAKLSLVPPARGRLGSAVQLTHVADLPVLEYNTWDASRSTLVLKRCLDVCVAAILLVVLAPVLAATAVAIYAQDRGPVLFRHCRAGLGGRPFAMWKFRTMVVDAESRLEELVRFDELDVPMFKFRRDPRVTTVGRFVRRLSLDELPQLVNVLRGDMSLVGPRPEQVELVARYTPELCFRLDVKPGLTGPMQVFGRGDLTFDERLAVERDYVENVSLGRDLRIIALTLAPVLTGRGAY